MKTTEDLEILLPALNVSSLIFTPLAKIDGHKPYKLRLSIFGCFEAVSTTHTSTAFTTTISTISTSTTATITFTTTSGFCRYSEWSDWSSCDVKCGESYQVRTRSVVSGTCFGSLKETKTCISNDCVCHITSQFQMLHFGMLPSDNVVGFVDKDGDNEFSSNDLIIMIDDDVALGTVIKTGNNCSEIICNENGLEVVTGKCSRN